MKVYISGAITGQPNPRLGFDRAAQALRALGHEAINPFELDHSGHAGQWEDFMRVDLAALLTCDAVCTLNGWRLSRGASIECSLAHDLGMVIKPVGEFLAVTA